MATLAFEVQADYDKVIKLREEITRLEKALDSMQGNGSKDAIETLESQLATAREQMRGVISTAAELGQSLDNSFKDSANAVGNIQFTSAQEQINALSYAIHQNDIVIADSVTQLQKWKKEGQDAFAKGDTSLLKAITADINAQVAKIQELTDETNGYKATLNELLSGEGMAGGNGDAPMLFKSEKDIQYVEQLQEKIQRLQTEIARLGAEGANTSALTAQLVSAKDALTGMQIEATKAASKLGTELGQSASEAQQKLYELNNACDAQKDVIANLSIAVDEAKEHYEIMLHTQSATSEEVERAASSYMVLSEQLANAEQQLASLEAQQAQAQTSWQNVSEEIAKHDSILVKMLGGYENYQKILGSLPAPIKNVVSGIQGMTGAAKAFIATPLGAIIAAITLALQALYKWFNSSAEGQRAFAKVSGYVSGVLGQLKEIVLAVGKALYTAFTDPQKAVKALWNAIKTNLVNRVNAVGGMFQALGKIIDRALHLDLSGAKDAFGDLLKQSSQLATGVENIGEKISNATKKLKDTAKATSDLNTREIELRQKRSENEKEDAEYEKRINELRNQSRTGTREQQLEATRKAEELINERYAKQIELAKEAYEIQKERNKLTTNSLEDTEKENHLQAEMTRLEAQREQALTRFVSRENTLSGGGGSSSSTSAGATTAPAITDADNKAYADALEKREKERIRQEKATQFAIRQAEIEAMEEGNQKTLAQINLDYEKQKEEIEQWYEDLKATKIKKAKELWDANPQNRGKLFDESSVDVAYTAEEEKLYDAKKNSAQRGYEQALDAMRSKEAEAMRNFLKDYGSYEEQRLALTEEYAEKIAKAETLGDKIALAAERNERLQELDFKFGDTTDWEAIFTNIDNYSVGYLEGLKEKLKELLSSDDITAEQAKTMGDQLSRINQLILEKSQSWKDVLGITSERQRELNQLLQAQIDAQDRLTLAQDAYNNTLDKSREIQTEISTILESMGIDSLTVDDINLANSGNILDIANENGATDEVITQLENLFVILGENKKAQSDYGKLVEDNTIALEAATDAYSTANKKTPQQKNEEAIETAERISEGLQELGDLSDVLGLDSSISQTFNQLSDGVNSSINAFKDFCSGNYIGAASSALSAVSSFGETLGLWGDSDKHLAEDIERMTLENQDLTKAINNLAEVMKSNTTSLTEAGDIYDAQIADLENAIANTQEMMERSASASKSGIGGHHSSNYKIDKGMSQSDWDAISDAAGVTITSAADFWNLTAEQMWNVQTYASSYYSKLKGLADDGYKDAAQYMDEYCDYWVQLQELEDAYSEKLTATNFDSVADNFKSALMDMSHSAADWADDFEDMMKEAVISAMLESTYNESLKAWYESFQSMLKDGILSPDEQAQLKSDYFDIVDSATKEIEALYDTMGWSVSGYSQQGTQGGFTAMSEDSAEELNGRFTALQEAGYEILAQDKVNGESIANMVVQLDLSNQHLSSITDISRDTLQMLANSYLELQSINDNTSRSVTQLLLMVGYLKTIRDNTDKL